MDDIAGLRIATVNIVRLMDEHGEMLDLVEANDGNGDPLGIAEALGMLRLAEHTLLNGDYE